MKNRKVFLWNRGGIYLYYHAEYGTPNETSRFSKSYFMDVTSMMQDLSDKPDKPWAKLRMNRRQYAASRMWKKCGIERADFERRLECIPDELITRMYEEADAELLVEAMFGKRVQCEEDV